MGSTLGLQVRDAGSNPKLVHFHSSCTWIDPLTSTKFVLLLPPTFKVGYQITQREGVLKNIYQFSFFCDTLIEITSNQDLLKLIN